LMNKDGSRPTAVGLLVVVYPFPRLLRTNYEIFYAFRTLGLNG
jgi:hypothetical protein